MAVKTARFVNLVLAGILTGNGFGGWAGTHAAQSAALPMTVADVTTADGPSSGWVVILVASVISTAVGLAVALRSRRP